MFFLSLDGQSIAIKLSKQITKVTDNIKRTLTCHNAIQGAVRLTFDEVKDPSSDLYGDVESRPSLVQVVPNSTRRTAIELHCYKERCEEEISLLKTEMERLVAFIHKQMNVLATAITNTEETGEAAKRTLGLNSLFLSRQAGCVRQLQALKRLWGELVPTLDLQEVSKSYHEFLDKNMFSEYTFNTEEENVDDCSSDSDHDTDYDSGE